MKIVVASEGFEVSSYFGRCSNYSYYTVQDGVIVDYQNMPNTEHLCSAIAPLMKELGVGVVITGGIGTNARAALEAEGISVISGASGDVRETAEAYVAGTLKSTDSPCTNEQ